MSAHRTPPGPVGSSSASRHGHLGLHPGQAEVNELFGRWREDSDHCAREELVRHFLPMARRLARRYRGAHEPDDDLQQVASVGLLKAMDRYDPSRASTFQSFAVPTILGEIKRYFRDCGWMIHVPRGTQDMALKVEQAQRTLLSSTGRPPTFQQLAQYLEMTLEDVWDAAEAASAHHSMSLDTPCDGGEGESLTTIGDTLGHIDDRYERVEEEMCIAQATRLLAERQRQVLNLRFVDDRTQTQIATEIGVSQMGVSRILHATLDRLSAIVKTEVANRSSDRGCL